MPTKQIVTIWETSEKLPEPGTMIVAELLCEEWEILMYDDDGAYVWEQDFTNYGDQPLEFTRWFYLGDLRKNKQMISGILFDTHQE